MEESPNPVEASDSPDGHDKLSPIADPEPQNNHDNKIVNSHNQTNNNVVSKNGHSPVAEETSKKPDIERLKSETTAFSESSNEKNIRLKKENLKESKSLDQSKLGSKSLDQTDSNVIAKNTPASSDGLRTEKSLSLPDSLAGEKAEERLKRLERAFLVGPGQEQHSYSLETLLDVLLVLHDECLNSSLRREKTLSDFIEYGESRFFCFFPGFIAIFILSSQQFVLREGYNPV